MSLDSTTNNGSIYNRASFKGLSTYDYPSLFSLKRGLHRSPLAP